MPPSACRTPQSQCSTVRISTSTRGRRRSRRSSTTTSTFWCRRFRTTRCRCPRRRGSSGGGSRLACSAGKTRGGIRNCRRRRGDRICSRSSQRSATASPSRRATTTSPRSRTSRSEVAGTPSRCPSPPRSTSAPAAGAVMAPMPSSSARRSTTPAITRTSIAGSNACSGTCHTESSVASSGRSPTLPCCRSSATPSSSSSMRPLPCSSTHPRSRVTCTTRRSRPSSSGRPSCIGRDRCSTASPASGSPGRVPTMQSCAP